MQYQSKFFAISAGRCESRFSGAKLAKDQVIPLDVYSTPLPIPDPQPLRDQVVGPAMGYHCKADIIPGVMSLLMLHAVTVSSVLRPQTPP